MAKFPIPPTRKERLRRQRISAALKLYYLNRRAEAAARIEAGYKAAETRRRKKAEAAGVAYHKPAFMPLVDAKTIKVGHGAKRQKPRVIRPSVVPIPAEVRKPEVLPPVAVPPKAAIEAPPAVLLPVAEPKPKRKKRKAEAVQPPTPVPTPIREPVPVTLPPAVPQPEEEEVEEVEEPEPLHLFESDAARTENDTWKGPWSEGNEPADFELSEAVDEIRRISESVALHMADERLMKEYGLHYPIKAWALNPVINDDRTISGEVRFDVPPGIDPDTIVQELQYSLPAPIIDHLWIIPRVVYEPRKDEAKNLLALFSSPFENTEGEFAIRTFALKYDNRVGVKSVTAFAKAEEMVDKIDPKRDFIRPGYIRIGIKYSERPPRSAYELRKMEEARVAKQQEKERLERLMEWKGNYKPIPKPKK